MNRFLKDLVSNNIKRGFSSGSKTGKYYVAKNEMENFMLRCMIAAGSKNDHAKSLAACLIAADYRGHFSHGLNRLGRNYD